jgi:hypothetical protein
MAAQVLASSLRAATFVNGRWRKPKISGKAMMAVKEDRPLREVPMPKFRVKKTMVAAKKAHDPLTIHKKVSKFHEQILAERKEYLMQRLQEKKLHSWFLQTWQEKKAMRNRKERLAKASLPSNEPVDIRHFNQLRRTLLLKMLTKKPGDAVNL